VFVTGGAMLGRLADGSYAEAGAFVDLAAWQPAFTAAVPGDTPLPDIGSVCVFASLLSNAFLAHYNAPAVYSELAGEPVPPAEGAKLGSDDGFLGRLRTATRAELVNANFRAFMESTQMLWLRRAGGAEAPAAAELAAADGGLVISGGALEDKLDVARLAAFRRVVTVAFSISGLLFILIAGAGFATFGDASQPFILANYASSDPLAAVARVGIGLCVLFEFPLLERPFRLTALQLLNLEVTVGTLQWALSACTSVAFLCGVAALGVPLDAISALSGSTGGALLIYVAPALMALQLAERKDAVGVAAPPQALLWTLAALGLVLSVIGTAEEVATLTSMGS